jgi:hypothetical protein
MAWRPTGSRPKPLVASRPGQPVVRATLVVRSPWGDFMPGTVIDVSSQTSGRATRTRALGSRRSGPRPSRSGKAPGGSASDLLETPRRRSPRPGGPSRRWAVPAPRRRGRRDRRARDGRKGPGRRLPRRTRGGPAPGHCCGRESAPGGHRPRARPRREPVPSPGPGRGRGGSAGGGRAAIAPDGTGPRRARRPAPGPPGSAPGPSRPPARRRSPAPSKARPAIAPPLPVRRPRPATRRTAAPRPRSDARRRSPRERAASATARGAPRPGSGGIRATSRHSHGYTASGSLSSHRYTAVELSTWPALAAIPARPVTQQACHGRPDLPARFRDRRG